MIIEKKILSKWRVLRSPADTREMAERLPGSAGETFNRAFRLGRCRDDVFKTMCEFYKEKEEMMKQYL